MAELRHFLHQFRKLRWAYALTYSYSDDRPDEIEETHFPAPMWWQASVLMIFGDYL